MKRNVKQISILIQRWQYEKEKDMGMLYSMNLYGKRNTIYGANNLFKT